MRLYILTWACCIALVCCQSGFMSDGSIEQLVFAQAAVMNTPEEATLVAIKYEDATILLEVTKKVELFTALKASVGNSESSLLYSNSKLRALLVGNKADAITAKVLCSELDANSRVNEGVELSAARMSPLLADAAQKCSMELSASRQLAFNALVINTETTNTQALQNTKKSRGFGDIYKVDVSGNFHRCRAVCIGAKEGRINSWLGTRGRFIASRLALKGSSSTSYAANNDDKQNGNGAEGDTAAAPVAAGDIVDHCIVSNCSLQNCFNISACCLLENYSRDALYSGNYSVCVTVLGGVGREGGGSAFSASAGPITVPVEVIRNLINGTSAVTDSTGCEAAASVGTRSLYRWWHSVQQLRPGGAGSAHTHCGNSEAGGVCDNVGDGQGTGTAAGADGASRFSAQPAPAVNRVPTWRLYS